MTCVSHKIQKLHLNWLMKHWQILSPVVIQVHLHLLTAHRFTALHSCPYIPQSLTSSSRRSGARKSLPKRDAPSVPNCRRLAPDSGSCRLLRLPARRTQRHLLRSCSVRATTNRSQTMSWTPLWQPAAPVTPQAIRVELLHLQTLVKQWTRLQVQLWDLVLLMEVVEVRFRGNYPKKHDPDIIL